MFRAKIRPPINKTVAYKILKRDDFGAQSKNFQLYVFIFHLYFLFCFNKVIENIWKQMTIYSKKEQIHPNVAIVFGVVTEPSLALLIEWFDDSLWDFLSSHPKVADPTQLKWAKQIASAMQTLHQNNIIICDLCSRNGMLKKKKK